MHIIRTGVFGVNTLIVPCGEKYCFVVDPAACSLSGDENKIVNYLNDKKMECVGIVLTHSHFDHITGIAPVKAAFPESKIAIHEAEFAEMQNPPGPMNDSVIRFFGALDLLNEVAKQPSAELSFNEGSTLEILSENPVIKENLKNWKVLHTPGHTPGSVCLYNKQEKILISGDTLFDYGGYGRTDMYGGNEAQIISSLARIKKDVEPGTIVYPGHDSFGFSI